MSCREDAPSGQEPGGSKARRRRSSQGGDPGVRRTTGTCTLGPSIRETSNRTQSAALDRLHASTAAYWPPHRRDPPPLFRLLFIDEVVEGDGQPFREAPGRFVQSPQTRTLCALMSKPKPHTACPRILLRTSLYTLPTHPLLRSPPPTSWPSHRTSSTPRRTGASASARRTPRRLVTITERGEMATTANGLLHGRGAGASTRACAPRPSQSRWRQIPST